MLSFWRTKDEVVIDWIERYEELMIGVAETCHGNQKECFHAHYALLKTSPNNLK